MLSGADHEAVVLSLYASAAGDAPWAQTLANLSSQFRIEHNVLNIADADWRTLAVEVHGKPVDYAIDYYGGELYAKDPRTPYLQGHRPGSVYYDHKLYDVDEMNRNPWCQEACRVLGVKYQLGAILRLPEGLTGAFALLPTEREGHASQDAIVAFRRVAPHIEQAVTLGVALDSQAATRSALLDALTSKAEGVILLNRAAQPTFMNSAAQAILQAHDGLQLSGDLFVTRRPPETRKLQQMIRTALASREGDVVAAPGGRLLVTRASGRRPYVVSVMAAPRLERFLVGHSIACIVHLQDLAAIRVPSRAGLQTVFGLTEREADLGIELVRCAHLEGAAFSAGMAVNTARNHLQSMLRKTGARGQAEIIQLLGALD